MSFNTYIKKDNDLGMKLFTCPICEKSFVHRSRLTQHMKFLPCEKAYSCNICHKTFMLKSYMLTHKMRHHLKEQIECASVEKSELLQNGTKPSIPNTEDGKKKYECPICEKTFQHRSSLPNHVMLHTGEKPYICNVCEKSFTQKSNMIDHWMRRHMKEQIECAPVEKDGLLSDESNLSIKNTGVAKKKYECSVCGIPFLYRSSLHHHIMLHSGEKSFVCNDCEKSFTQKSSLLEHRMKYHMKEETHFIYAESE